MAVALILVAKNELAGEWYTLWDDELNRPVCFIKEKDTAQIVDSGFAQYQNKIDELSCE